MDKCLHPSIEPVAIIGVRELPNGERERYVETQAMRCACGKIWPYVEPDDLPHWLYEKLREEGRLPMPNLTPEILKALQDSAGGKHG